MHSVASNFDGASNHRVAKTIGDFKKEHFLYIQLLYIVLFSVKGSKSVLPHNFCLQQMGQSTGDIQMTEFKIQPLRLCLFLSFSCCLNSLTLSLQLSFISLSVSPVSLVSH